MIQKTQEEKMSIVSYSQRLEDIILWRALCHVRSGFYIDIGARSPDFDSVTRIFYEKGWNGINIESHPKYYSDLMIKRKKDINLNLMIGDKIGYNEIYFLGDSGLSTFDPIIANKYKNDLGYSIEMKEIEVTTLNSFWSKYVSNFNRVNFIKINLEDFEKSAVLEENDWENNRPWIIVLKEVLPLVQVKNHQDFENILLKYNYIFVYYDGVNRFYVAKEHYYLSEYLYFSHNVFDELITKNLKEMDDSLQQAIKRAELAEESEKQVKSILQAVYAGRSWRLTFPLRWISRQLKRVREKGIKASVGIAIEKFKCHLKDLFRIYIKEKKKKIKSEHFDKNWYLIKTESGKSFFYSPVSLKFQEIIKPNESIRFNLHHAINKYSPKGIALVFFMGMGDYIFITPFISQLRAEFPFLKIIAFVSDSKDVYNSPYVFDLLKINKNIDDVLLYHGFSDCNNWKNYNYNDAKKKCPENFLLLPIIYEYNGLINNRAYSLCDNYGIKMPLNNDLKLDVLDESINGEKVVKDIFNKTLLKRKIVFLHLDTRSSNYLYPFRKELCEALLFEDCVVVSFTKIDCNDENYIQIDVSELNINESIFIVSKINKMFKKNISMITTPSVMGAVSSALGIINLQLQHRKDDGLRSIFFDNIFLVTNYEYEHINKKNMFLVKPSEYQFNSSGYVDYHPSTVMNAWRVLQNMDLSKRRL